MSTHNIFYGEIEKIIKIITKWSLSASVAQSDERPTGDQEMAGSFPIGFGNIFSGD